MKLGQESTDTHYLLAIAEEREIERARRYEDRKRQSRRDAELAKRQALRDEIERMVSL